MALILRFAAHCSFFLVLCYCHEPYSNINSEEAVILEPHFTKIKGDIPGAEGPVFDSAGHFFLVAPDVEKDFKFAGEVLNIDLFTKETRLVAIPSVNGDGGIPAAVQADRHNNLWVADMRLGLLRINSEGILNQHTRNDSSGNTLQGCNDCVFDYEGTLWITAPAGDIAPAHYRRSFQEAFGSVYCKLRTGEVIKVDTGLRFPNGIAVLHTKDGRPKKLIVAETPTKLIWGYDIIAPGIIANKAVWGILQGNHDGGADGMDFDSEDNLLVAHWGSGFIEVFGPEGRYPKMRIKCPFKKVSNLHFHPRSNTVYVTEHDTYSLWKFQWQRKGKRHLCEL